VRPPCCTRSLTHCELLLTKQRLTAKTHRTTAVLSSSDSSLTRPRAIGRVAERATWDTEIPIYCPALTDGSIGDMLYFHTFKNPGLVLDIVQDIRKCGPCASMHHATATALGSRCSLNARPTGNSG
jgi:hypothetical protein